MKMVIHMADGKYISMHGIEKDNADGFCDTLNTDRYGTTNFANSDGSRWIVRHFHVTFVGISEEENDE